MQTRLFKLTLLALFLLFSGCAVKNTGSTDFRRTIDGNLSVKHLTLGKGSEIKKGDTLSIHLKTAFIKSFRERETSFESLYHSKSNGEIAIFVDAKELGKKEGFDFVDYKNDRLVYFSDSVEKGQFLNLYNLPIYGPKIYNGEPFGLKLSIIELDVIKDSTKNAIKNISNMGTKAYPQSAPAIKLLNKLVSSMLKGDKNDVEFDYVMVLDDKIGTDKVPHFALETGTYVFIKKDNPTQKHNWENITFDNSDSRLYDKKVKGSKIPYTESTYLVIEINKNILLSKEGIKTIVYNELIGKLKAKETIFGEDDINASKHIEDILKKKSQKQNYLNAVAMIEETKVTKSNYKIKSNVEKIIDMIVAPQTKSKLSDSDIELLIDRLAELSGADEKNYIIFQKSVIGVAKNRKAIADKIIKKRKQKNLLKVKNNE